jgi:hypothetical protein
VFASAGDPPPWSIGPAVSACRWARRVALLSGASIVVGCGGPGIVPAPSAGPSAADKDAAAKNVAARAQEAAEVIALGDGSYAAATPQRLVQLEPELAATAGVALVRASLDDAGSRYTITARSVSTGDTFSVALRSGAPPVRSCTGGGGCFDGSW